MMYGFGDDPNVSFTILLNTLIKSMYLFIYFPKGKHTYVYTLKCICLKCNNRKLNVAGLEISAR